MNVLSALYQAMGFSTSKYYKPRICNRVPTDDASSTSKSYSSKPTIHDRLRDLIGDEITEQQLLERYTFGRVLGSGATSKVYAAIDNITFERVAIKVFAKVDMIQTRCSMAVSDSTISNERAVDRVRRRLLKIISEIEIMKSLDHPNIIRMLGACETPFRICIIFERSEGSDLLEYLLANGRMEEKKAAFVIQQLLSALQYCHSQNLYHRDLKLENVLITPQLDIKLIDFGLSEYAKGKRVKSVCGTPLYCSPEILFMNTPVMRNNDGFHAGPADVWSIGILIFCLLTGCAPFDDSNLVRLREDVYRCRIQIPSDLSLAIKMMLKAILVSDPIVRPTVEDLLDYGWVCGLEKTRVQTPRRSQRALSLSPQCTKLCTYATLNRTSDEGSERTTRSSFSFDELEPRRIGNRLGIRTTRNSYSSAYTCI